MAQTYIYVINESGTGFKALTLSGAIAGSRIIDGNVTSITPVGDGSAYITWRDRHGRLHGGRIPKGSNGLITDTRLI